eukprot:3822172-Prymnesium_polylepis.2
MGSVYRDRLHVERKRKTGTDKRFLLRQRTVPAGPPPEWQRRRGNQCRILVCPGPLSSRPVSLA